jgi:hypothetical protein
VGLDLGHFQNEIGIEARNLTIDGFDVGVRISAVGEIAVRDVALANAVDLQYVVPDEDGGFVVVDGPGEASPVDDDEAGESESGDGQESDDDEFEDDEFEDDEFADDEFADDRFEGDESEDDE